jgi:hypothetical protein
MVVIDGLLILRKRRAAAANRREPQQYESPSMAEMSSDGHRGQPTLVPTPGQIAELRAQPPSRQGVVNG